MTSDRVESYSPAWSPDGKWLYFLSDRELRSLVASPWGPRQPDPFFTETTKIYPLALTKGLRSPFVPKDELQSDEPDEKKDEKKEKNGDEADKAKPSDAEKASEGEAGRQSRKQEGQAGDGSRSTWPDWRAACLKCRCRRAITAASKSPPSTCSGRRRIWASTPSPI